MIKLKIYIFLSLLLFTIADVLCFFYIKNSTYYLRKDVAILKSDVENEKHNLSIKQAEFNKIHNIQNLQELNKKLNLQFSNVKQITDFEDVFVKN